MSGIRNRLHAIYIVLYCQLNLPHYRQRRIEYPTVPSVRRHSFSVIVDRQTNITVHVVLLVEQHLYYKSRYETAIVPYFTDRVEVNYFQISSYPVRFFAEFCFTILASSHCNILNLLTKAQDMARRVVHNLYCISKSRMH